MLGMRLQKECASKTLERLEKVSARLNRFFYSTFRILQFLYATFIQHSKEVENLFQEVQLGLL